jgi:hypothetical protein
MHDGIMRNLALVKEMEAFSKFDSVLDVGGEKKSQKIFFPDKKFHIVNIFNSTQEEDVGFTLSSAADMPFEDGSFDLVVSSDTLEHIPFEDRNKAINEMIRVAKKRVFLLVPCDQHSKKYEKKVLKLGLFFKRNMKWLREHEECGLPMSSEIEKTILENNNVDKLSVKNNHNIYAWYFGSLINPLVRAVFSNLDRTKLIKFWKFWKLFDKGNNSYRKIFIIDKKMN